MSHQIEIIDGRASFAYDGEPAWHKLGQSGAWKTKEEWMRHSGTDFEVKLTNCFTEIRHDGKVRRIPTNTRALVRTSDLKVLTTTGKKWHPLQNSEAYDFFFDYIEKAKLKMHTAGSLKGGKLVWVLAKTTNGFSLFKGKDEIESYVLFHVSHEYGKSSGVMGTSVRVVCANTFAEALSQLDEAAFHSRISHRKAFEPSLVKTQMDKVAEQIKQYKEIAELLSTRKMTVPSFKEFVAEVFPSKSQEDEKPSRLAEIAAGVLETQPGAGLGEGSWWQGWNAVTFTMDHLMGQQYKSEPDDTGMRDRRLTQSWFGWSQRRKVFALQRAAQLARQARAA